MENLAKCKNIKNLLKSKNLGPKKISKKLAKFRNIKFVVKNITISKNYSFLTFNTRLAFI